MSVLDRLKALVLAGRALGMLTTVVVLTDEDWQAFAKDGTKKTIARVPVVEMMPWPSLVRPLSYVLLEQRVHDPADYVTREQVYTQAGLEDVTPMGMRQHCPFNGCFA